MCAPGAWGSCPAVDTDRAEALEAALQAYLDQYMSDMPQGHKWIILCCLYLSMVAGEPLHPQAVAGWRREGDRYYCRAREEQPGSTCLWCACRPYAELDTEKRYSPCAKQRCAFQVFPPCICSRRARA